MHFLMEVDLPATSAFAHESVACRSSFSSRVVLFGIAFFLLGPPMTVTLREGWKVQSSAKVTGGGEKVSSQGFDTTGWYKTTAPNTVFAVLVENGVYKDPYFGMNLRSVPGIDYPIGGQFANLDMPANSPYAVPWWYRKEFEVPKQFKGRTVWMAFRGINYRAEHLDQRKKSRRFRSSRRRVSPLRI